jgi:hypothetical protein
VSAGLDGPRADWLRKDRDYARDGMRVMVRAYAELQSAMDAVSSREPSWLARLRRRIAALLGSPPRAKPVTSLQRWKRQGDGWGLVVAVATNPRSVRLPPVHGGAFRLWASAVSTTSAATFELCVAATCRNEDTHGTAAKTSRALRLPAGRTICIASPDELTPISELMLWRSRGELFTVHLQLQPESSVPDRVLSHEGSAESGEAQRHTLWTAQQMVRDGKGKEAVVFALATASRKELPAVDLLIANANRDDECIWLAHLNSYLGTFRLAPIALSPGSDTRLMRMQTEPLPPVERGPIVSVIMPAHNAQATLTAAARSILDQTWRPLELIIVDDASTDETWAVISALSAGDARVRGVRNTVNVGPYVTKNLALSIAGGTYITGHDADDWAHPQRLERQLSGVLAEDKPVACMAGMLRMEADGRFSDFTRQGRTSADGALRDAPISMLIDAAFFRSALGHWDCSRFGADGEIVERLEHVAQHRLVRTRELGMICLDRAGSLTNDREHGVIEDLGVSPTRREYRDLWRKWHCTLDAGSSALPFPHTPRRFPLPSVMAVPDAAINANIESWCQADAHNIAGAHSSQPE